MMKKGSQKIIATKAGISHSMLNQILSGKKRAGWRSAKGLAIATNTDPVLWLDGTIDEIRAAYENALLPSNKYDRDEFQKEIDRIKQIPRTPAVKP